MQIRRRYLTVALVAALLFTASASSAQQSARVAPADIMIVHAKIYTMDEKRPWAQSLAIRKGKIVAVGTDEEVGRLRGIGTKFIDAGGKLVLPGLTDCHIHFIDGGFSLKRANLEGAKGVSEIQGRLRAYLEQHLDAPSPNRPVILEGYDGHTYWANSKVLALSGIATTTPNTPNRQIVRDPKTGEPTGALKESAGDLVSKVVPKPDRVDRLNTLREGMKWANQNGITRVHSAGGDFDQLDLLQELREEKQLSVRFHIAFSLEPPELRPQDIYAIEAARKRFHDDWINVNSVKFYLDGVVESHTAAFLDPYTDEPSKKGSLFWDPGKYKAAVAELDKKGLQLYTHAIGDYAVRMALDAYEFAARENHSKDHRNRVEHVETIAAADIPRFGKLGVIASMQPLNAYPDEDTLEVWARNAGPERAARAWVWKSIADYGGHYAFGSDWPVVTLSPWQGIQTAVTRQTSDGKPPGSFVPSERLTVAQAVRGYTVEAAYAGHREKTEGSLESGKVADVIMVDRNIFEIDPHAIDQTKVVLTLVGGKIVYEADTP